MQTGTQKTLAETLKKRLKTERLKTETIFKTNLEELSKTLQESSKEELHTIETAIKHQTEQTSSTLIHHYTTLNKTIAKRWIITALLAIAVIIGIAAGSWGTLKAISFKITSKLENLNYLETRIKEAEQTLNYLNKETFGIYLMTEEKGNFIVIPEDTTIETNWKYRTRQSIRLIKKQ